MLDARQLTKFWSKVQIGDGCWEWQASRHPFGYGSFQVYGEKTGAHRVSWAVAHGRWPTKQVLHHCDNPPCVRPDHLYEGDHRQNMADRSARNRMQTGERHANSKLTEVQVAEARSRWVAGETQTALSKEFGVSQAQISNIVRGIQRGGERLEQPTQLPQYRLVCQQCGGDFYRKPGGRKTRFCSRACSGISQRQGEPQTCAVCGTVFQRPPSANAMTCSYACMGVLQSQTGRVRGANNGNSKVTDVQRDEIRRRRAVGERAADLADEFGLSRDQIARITSA